jgi:hypothetical protein
MGLGPYETSCYVSLKRDICGPLDRTRLDVTVPVCTDGLEFRQCDVRKDCLSMQIHCKNGRADRHTSLRAAVARFVLRISIQSSAPISTGNTFQDLPRLRGTADNTERYT